MKLFGTLSLALLIPALASTVKISSDAKYDDSEGRPDSISCRSWLEGRDFEFFGYIPRFPFIGAAQDIEGEGSSNCGTCFAVAYGEQTVPFLAINYAEAGYVVSQEMMINLTGSADATINAEVSPLDRRYCGFDDE